MSSRPPPSGQTAATLAIRVRPNARKTEVLGYREGVLTVAIAAPPLDGRANEALLTYLASVLRVGRGQLILRRGSRSRDKLVMVEGLASQQITARLAPFGR